MSSTVVSELLEEIGPGKKVLVGSLVTQRPITGSRVNESGIVELSLHQKNAEDPGFMTWLLAAKFWVDGSPRALMIWEFKAYEQRGELVILRQLVLKPEGLCIACAGTGKYQASRHIATAKCPSCKGKGFLTGVWPAEPEPKKKEDDEKNVAQGEEGKTGGVVAGSQDADKPARNEG